MSPPPTSATPTTSPDEWRALGVEIVASPATRPGEVAVELPWPTRGEVLDLAASASAPLAALLITLGVLWWFAGGKLWRYAVAANVGGLGAWGGWELGELVAPGGGIGGLVIAGLATSAAALAVPRVAATVTGGVVGFALGVAGWRMIGLAEPYAAAGGAIVGVWLGMLPLAAARVGPTAILATQGAIMFAGGVLGLALRYDPPREAAESLSGQWPWAPPAALLVAAVLAIFFHRPWEQDQEKK